MGGRRGSSACVLHQSNHCVPSRPLTPRRPPPSPPASACCWLSGRCLAWRPFSRGSARGWHRPTPSPLPSPCPPTTWQVGGRQGRAARGRPPLTSSRRSSRRSGPPRPPAHMLVHWRAVVNCRPLPAPRRRVRSGGDLSAGRRQPSAPAHPVHRCVDGGLLSRLLWSRSAHPAAPACPALAAPHALPVMVQWLTKRMR